MREEIRNWWEQENTPVVEFKFQDGSWSVDEYTRK